MPAETPAAVAILPAIDDAVVRRHRAVLASARRSPPSGSSPARPRGSPPRRAPASRCRPTSSTSCARARRRSRRAAPGPRPGSGSASRRGRAARRARGTSANVASRLDDAARRRRAPGRARPRASARARPGRRLRTSYGPDAVERGEAARRAAIAISMARSFQARRAPRLHDASSARCGHRRRRSGRAGALREHRLGGRLGLLELAAHELQAAVPEARVGEVQAGDRGQVLGAAASRRRRASPGRRGRTPRPPRGSARRPTARAAGRRRRRRRSPGVPMKCGT